MFNSTLRGKRLPSATGRKSRDLKQGQRLLMVFINLFLNLVKTLHYKHITQLAG